MPPVVALKLRVEFPEPSEARLTLAGLSEAVGPEGETDTVNTMAPAKPPRLLDTMVEPPDCPAKMLRLAEPVEMEKSTTLTFT